MVERESFARDSEIRIMASSWRTVIGIELRWFADTSFAWTVRRIETKCEESFSAASGDRRGAHFLDITLAVVWEEVRLSLTVCSNLYTASSSQLESLLALAPQHHDHP
jgi:hypothetical protein